MRVLYNARIKTLDPNQPAPTAAAIDRDRIAQVGSDTEILDA